MDEQAQIKEISLPLYQVKGWMKLLGVVGIVYGALIALTGVGLIIAWLPIWMGILLFKAASGAEGAQLTGDKNQLMLSLWKLKTYFVINGVLLAIGLAVMVIMMITFGAGLFAMLSGAGR